MTPLLSRVRNSLFLRLLSIFGGTVFLIAAIIYAALQQLGQTGQNQIVAIPDFFVRNIESIIDEIGSPPDLDQAIVLAQELDWTIIIRDDTLLWRSDTDFRLDIDNAIFSRTLAEDAEIRVVNNEDVIFVTRGGYQYILHQRYLEAPQANYVVLYIGFALAAVVLFLNYLAVNRLLNPIRQLKSGAERIRAGDLSYRVQTNRQDELGELTDSVNHMADSLQSMLEAKRQLLLAISHELRTPITRAKLQLEFLDDSQEIRNLREDLNEIDLLISDLLEAERLNNTHSVLAPESIEMSAFVESVLDAFHHYAGELRYEGPAEDRVVVIDKLRIRLLLTNLLNNATRHGEGKPITVRLQFFEQTMQVEVIDEGEGIAPEHIEKLTEPFYRADSARRRNTGGFGLGLYLCRLIVEVHGGSLTIRSEKGAGTHICVELPYAPPAENITA